MKEGPPREHRDPSGEPRRWGAVAHRAV